LRVFDGIAEVTAGDRTVEVKDSHLIALDTLAVGRFDRNVTDALNRWSERRDEYVSMANVAAARSVQSSMVGGGNMFSNGWYWNPFFGMYSYVPGLGGMAYSPYGCPMFSPWDVYMAFSPSYYYPCYSGYRSPVYYNNVYNTLAYKSVPQPRRPPIHFAGPTRPTQSASSGRGSSSAWGSGAATSASSAGTASSASASHGGSIGGGSVGGGHR
jgi:hypothetical protein